MNLCDNLLCYLMEFIERRRFVAGIYSGITGRDITVDLFCRSSLINVSFLMFNLYETV